MKVWSGAFCAIIMVAVAIFFAMSNQQSESVVNRPGMTKDLERLQSKRELKTAIAGATRALADAQERVQEDEWGMSQPLAETRASTEASEPRSNQSMREVHLAEVNAAKERLQDLKAQLANSLN